MPVEQNELSQVRTQVELLAERVESIQEARHRERMDELEKRRKRDERELLIFWVVLWMILVATWSAIITAAIVSD